MSGSDFFAAAVVGGVVGSLASLGTVVLKDLLFPRYLEGWKTSKKLDHLFSRYRDPIMLAGEELYWRLHEVLEQRFEYLAQSVPASDERGKPTYGAPFFVQYKKHSTLYRFCAFLGWLELYRTDARFLQPHKAKVTLGVDKKVSRIQAILADRKLNASGDADGWNDRVIFREEQRAIGQIMLTKAPDGDVDVVGYKMFTDDVCEQESAWISVVENFFAGIKHDANCDFRLVRLHLLCIFLIDLALSLQRKGESSLIAQFRDTHVAYVRDHVGKTGNTGLFLYSQGDLSQTGP